MGRGPRGVRSFQDQLWPWSFPWGGGGVMLRQCGSHVHHLTVEGD